MYFPDRMIWCSEDREHALAFSPSYHCNGQTFSWEKASSFASLNERTTELFSSQGTDIYYVGTYICRSIELPSEGIMIPKEVVGPSYHSPRAPSYPHQSAISLIKAAIPRKQGAPLNSVAKITDEPTLVHLYENGVLKAECMALQCVGFNHDLYTALLRRFEPRIGKRKEPPPDKPKPRQEPKRPKRSGRGGGRGGARVVSA